MKKFYVFILISFCLFSKAQNSEKTWEKVLELESEQKISASLKKVNALYQKALKEQNDNEIIKCFFYQSKYLQTLQADSKKLIIDDLKAKIALVSKEAKPILKLVLAECYQKYRQTSKISYSTSVLENLPNDFTIWNHKQFVDEIKKLYDETLENQEQLSKIPLQKFEPIFVFRDDIEFKNTSLLDFLVSENIKYYSADYYIDFSKKFINETAFFANSEIFLNYKTADVKNLELKKLITLFQILEKNPSQEKLFNRIVFFNQKIQANRKAFEAALENLETQCKDDFLMQKILMQKIKILQSSKNKNTFFEILKLIDKILKVENRSNTFKEATLLKQEIERKNIVVSTKKIIYPNEKHRAQINYKTQNEVTISFYQINHRDFLFLAKNEKIKKDSLIGQIRKKNNLFHTEKYALPNSNDYNLHTTEVLLPKLPIGNFLMLFECFDSSLNLLSTGNQTIVSTKIGVLGHSKNDANCFETLDRETGTPLKNVVISEKENTIFTSNNNENCMVSKKRNYYDAFTFILPKDTITIFDGYFPNQNEDEDEGEEDQQKRKISLYLDRAIYRPGQTVYFKGIAFQKNGINKSVVENLLVHVDLKNNNGDVIAKMDATTNDFGSFTGSFVLPKNTSTGGFSIQVDEPEDVSKCLLFDKKNKTHPFWDGDFNADNVDFKVEEYKRPRFEIRFKPLTQNIVIGQKATIKGSAKAFSGSTVSQSKVQYTISAMAHQNYKKRSNWSTFDDVVGETTTNENGDFEIVFDVKRFEKSNEKELPIVEYNISASITDINGETRTAQKTLKVGYHTLAISAKLPQEIDVNNTIATTIQTTNLNGENVFKNCEIKIYFRESFDNRFKPSCFDGYVNADYYEKMPNFLTEFPFEKNDFSKPKDTTGTLVFNQKIDTKVQKTLPLSFLKNYKTGYYKFVISAIDDFGHKIEDEKLFQLTDVSKPKSDVLFQTQLIESDYKKNGFAEFKIHAIKPEIFVIAKVFYEGKVIKTERFFTKNGEGSLKIPIEKNHQSNVEVVFESLFENNVFKEVRAIYLKNESKSIDIETETIRNKIEPGSAEIWKFKIKPEAENLPTEILASMYDASLDSFSEKKWALLKFNEKYNSGSNFRDFLGKENKSENLNFKNKYQKSYKSKNENIFLFNFGFVFNHPKNTFFEAEYKNLIEKKRSKNRKNNLICGFVFDDEDPLAGVSVSVGGSSRKVVTDFDGYYEIEAFPGEELIVKYVGFNEESFLVVSEKRIDFFMKAKDNLLETVVIQAYGITTTKSNLSAAVQTSIENDVSYNPSSQLLQTLQGKVAGVNHSWGGFDDTIRIRGGATTSGAEPLYFLDGEIIDSGFFTNISPNDVISLQVLKGNDATALYGTRGFNGVILIYTKNALQQLKNVKIRKNLSETAFFFPNIKTDAKGNFELNFTSPEALSQWKLRLLAHNKTANSGYLENNIITQKELMLTPNFPRFFREKDTITITAKVSNATNLPKNGIATLQFVDVISQKNIDVEMKNSNNIQNFNLKASGNSTMSWTVVVPENLIGIHYKIIAKADQFSDGEENEIPVLSNNQLVTETVPLWVKANSEKEFVMENLKNNTSKTLKNHQLVVEYTSNTSWLVLQSLPYLMEYEHDCAEQLFAKFYANSLANQIISSQPEIASLFEKWRTKNSKLAENENLKNIDLSQTPWASDQESDKEKQQKLATLFDLQKTVLAQNTLIDQLILKQKSSGGFTWFGGETENLFITKHILAGFGHLKKIAPKSIDNKKISKMLKDAIDFLDGNFDSSIKNEVSIAENLHYLYARSFFVSEFEISEKLNLKIKPTLNSIAANWKTFSLFEKTLSALVLHRFNETETSKKILLSLKETAVTDKTFGMFWTENKSGHRWNESAVETQCLIIEAFAEIANDEKTIEDLKMWLLKNKISSSWKTTKATTESAYAMLIQGKSIDLKPNQVTFKFFDKAIDSQENAEKQDDVNAGLVKMVWKANKVDSEKSNLLINNKSEQTGFGGFYWQYFEDLDQIKPGANTNLSVSKTLYHKNSTVNGFELAKITEKNPLKIGDLVTIKIEINCTQTTDFVHLKDMRASCFEPVDTLSSYEFNGGLYYYKSTKDAATNFFFDKIYEGKYILEYDVRVNNLGAFSNGISTIQSMYAPEFSGHSNGIRIKVE
jgi:TonB-dependent SusC/RagA subfamily outer membrane receptor